MPIHANNDSMLYKISVKRTMFIYICSWLTNLCNGSRYWFQSKLPTHATDAQKENKKEKFFSVQHYSQPDVINNEIPRRMWKKHHSSASVCNTHVDFNSGIVQRKHSTNRHNEPSDQICYIVHVNPSRQQHTLCVSRYLRPTRNHNT